MNGTLFIILVWNAALTVGLVFLVLTLRQLFPARGRGIKHLLDEVFGRQEGIRASLRKIEGSVEAHKNITNLYISRYGLVRFNPFDRLGGEQSYCLALLNEEKNGIVVTFLYARDGIRVFLKEVVKGKGKDVDLSEEEKKAIVKAEVL